jgi:hypothetical protein
MVRRGARHNHASEVQGLFSCSLFINSAMFRYPPTLLIYAGDSLVSKGSGSASAMRSNAGIGTWEEKFTLAKLVRCVASIEEKLGVVADPLQLLEFPRFDDTGEQFSWLINNEKYFWA